MDSQTPRLYTELADWFHLLTAPEDYAEESEFYLKTFTAAIGRTPQTLLELGSGGGNMASHYKQHVTATLVDVAPRMLALSERINPECEHILGDMRTVRLGRTFDVVFVHDAVCYICTLEDLAKVFETAFVHCRAGGAVIFAPDDIRDTFTESTDHGGHDGIDRSLRYLEWSTDPDPSDSTYTNDFVYMLRERGKPLRIEVDTHVCGLFRAQDWIRGIEAAGFTQVTTMQGPAEPTRSYTIFVAKRQRV